MAELFPDLAPAPARPLDTWLPANIGQLSMRIDAQGNWHHAGRPVRRQRMVRLFASLLRREGEAYFLVTPQEKFEVQVFDVPFIATAMAWRKNTLHFRTNVDDVVAVDAERPLTLRPAPQGLELAYVQVREGLEARLSRAVFYELISRLDENQHPLGITSAGCFFPLVCR